MFKSYKYRIYPNDAQKIKIEQTISICRLVYNLALEAKMSAFKANRTKLSAFDLCYQLAEMKKEYKWMKEVDSQALQASVKKIDKAFKSFFDGNGYPKFKTKKGRQSFRCPNTPKRIDFKKCLLTIPKIKNIPIRISREFEGEIKTVTISRVPSGKYFASILVDNGAEKIANVRKDYLHKESTKIAKANHTVFLEDLNIKGMSRNKNLSKHILDCGWGIFRTMLEYKTNVIAIDPKYTSQTCNECGVKDSKSRLSQSEFCCTSCGHISNADENAAKNILSKGIALNRQREAIACA